MSNVHDVPSAAMYRVAGRTYPLKTVKGCNVCNSPWRAAVENYLVSGYSYAKIAEYLPEGSEIKPQDISRHFKGKHLAMEEDVRRMIIERRATELRFDPEKEAASLNDHLGFLRLGVHDVVERMARRELQPDIKDGIAMARILAQIDVDIDTAQYLGVYKESITTILRLVRDMMPTDQFQEFTKRLLDEPVMKELMESQKGELPTKSQAVQVPTRADESA